MSHMETGYGFFPGGDPREFEPDRESNTEEELEAHRLACKAFDEGDERVIQAGCVVVGGRVVNISRLGLGVYRFRCECDEEPDEGG